MKYFCENIIFVSVYRNKLCCFDDLNVDFIIQIYSFFEKTTDEFWKRHGTTVSANLRLLSQPNDIQKQIQTKCKRERPMAQFDGA